MGHIQAHKVTREQSHYTNEQSFLISCLKIYMRLFQCITFAVQDLVKRYPLFLQASKIAYICALYVAKGNDYMVNIMMMNWMVFNHMNDYNLVKAACSSFYAN